MNYPFMGKLSIKVMILVKNKQMRIITVCRHLDAYCGENQVPEIEFSDMQDIDEPEIFESASERVVLKRTLLKYLSDETAEKLIKSPNERIGAYALFATNGPTGRYNRYTLVMFFEMELSDVKIGEEEGFALHLADVFC